MIRFHHLGLASSYDSCYLTICLEPFPRSIYHHFYLKAWSRVWRVYQDQEIINHPLIESSHSFYLIFLLLISVNHRIFTTKVEMKAFVRSFDITFRYFFLSFIKIDKNGAKFSYFWFAFNSLKLFGFSVLLFSSLLNSINAQVLLKSSSNFERYSFLTLEMLFLNTNWTFLIFKRKFILKSFNMAQNLAEKLKISVDHSEISKAAIKKSFCAFLIFYFYAIFQVIFNILSQSPISIKLMYARFLVYSFLTIFYFATEFLLTCIKVVIEKLSRVLKAQRVVILSSTSTNDQRMKSYDEIANAVETMSSSHDELFQFSKNLEKSLEMTAALLLIFQLSTIAMEVCMSINN